VFIEDAFGHGLINSRLKFVGAPPFQRLGRHVRYCIVHDKDGDDCTVSSAQGLADAYLAYLKKGPKPSGLYVLR
jgi:hypothetical protein